MKRKTDFEKALEAKFKKDLSFSAPDVWQNINEKAQQLILESPDKPRKHSFLSGLLNKRLLLRAVPALLAAAVIVTGVSLFFYKLPLLQAKADVIYDSGGHLGSSANAAEPSGGFINSYNSFGLDILKQLCGGNKNVFVSPASIYIALGMAYNGAGGQTAVDFAKTLGVPGESLGTFNSGCLGLQGLITGSGRFRLADSIWLNKNYSNNISDSFIKSDKTFFGASVTTLDFSTLGAPSVINRWVKSNTSGKIDPNFKKLDPDIAMYIINSVYFKSDWKEKFNGNNTSDGSFKSPSGSKTVKFMNGTYNGYFENDFLQGIVLPYDDNKTSMLILLPKINLIDMLGKLTAADLTAFTKDNLNNGVYAELGLPRVNLSYDTSLSDTLKALGLGSAFDPRKADFSAMTKTDAGLYISDVKHMTYLAIDEKGTEAAAITHIAMSGSAMRKNVLFADHPFLTAIVNNETGAALFIGAVTDPSAK